MSTNRPPTDPHSLGIPEKGSTSVARAFGTARPPLRVPTVLGDVIARKALINCRMKRQAMAKEASYVRAKTTSR